MKLKYSRYILAHYVTSRTASGTRSGWPDSLMIAICGLGTPKLSAYSPEQKDHNRIKTDSISDPER